MKILKFCKAQTVIIKIINQIMKVVDNKSKMNLIRIS